MSLSTRPATLPLKQSIRIQSTFSRSINLTRDSESLDLVRSYLPTSRALEALRQIAEGLSNEPASRALALIGPYGSGKSAFGLFLGALLSVSKSELHQVALTTLQASAPVLAAHFGRALSAPKGFLRIRINGIPDSLTRQLMLALAGAVERSGLASALVNRIRAVAQAGIPMDQILALIDTVQKAWAKVGGAGLLIEIDELGKFLEYESYHPQHREIHLLQLLAEKAAEAHLAPLHLIVMLHQAFEHYGNRLGTSLRDEWQKVQGRFGTIAFLEPAEQSLRVVGAAFVRDGPLAPEATTQLMQAAERLAAAGALPLGMDKDQAQELFDRCYPLHPLTLLILPVLCQKVAQNERTLFSYLASTEPYGLRQRLGQIAMGEWIGPWDLYDYFIVNQTAGFSDPLTYHRWVEVITAQERFEGVCDADDPASRLLKTIGLLNLIGAQRGLKAAPPLLELTFGESTARLLARLEEASIVHFRSYSHEYRVWQGSDFDLHGALQQSAAEQSSLSLADTLNGLAPLRPIVARRASIETGTLRTYMPAFASLECWPPKAVAGGDLPLWFYLASIDEQPDLSQTPSLGVVAICRFTERLREVVTEWTALQDLPRHHAALHQDPVAQREHQAWLRNAETEATQLIHTVLEEPEALSWYFGGKPHAIRSRRHLQAELSAWIEDICYPKAPLIRNELINREQPSASAATGRKRLLAAMLAAPDRAGLNIEKIPAEKSLYLSLLKESALHRVEAGRWDFFPPPNYDPCRLRPVWDAISETLGYAGERQVGLPEIFAKLQQPPFGVRLGILPILIVTYLLAHRREVALYQEGAFCEALTIDQAELLCRRPALFALERFELVGLRGDLFDSYLSSVVGNLRSDATLLDIVRPLVRFASSLPEYSQHCPGLSPQAKAVRDAFAQAKSPGALLFNALPLACDLSPEAFAANDPGIVEGFIQRLIQVLRELRGAYPALLAHWQQEIARTLIGSELAELAILRQGLAERYRGLDRYSPDNGPIGAFVRRLVDEGYPTDTAWLESVMTLLGGVPPAKWRESTRLQAQLRLADFAGQLRDVEQLRQAMPDADAPKDALLVKLIDSAQGEISKVLRLSPTQRQAAALRAEEIAVSLATLDESSRLAVVAALLKRFTDTPTTGGQNHD
jgi:hypothetical protein